MASKIFYCVFSIIAFFEQHNLQWHKQLDLCETPNESKFSTECEYSDYFCLSDQIKKSGTNFNLTKGMAGKFLKIKYK